MISHASVSKSGSQNRPEDPNQPLICSRNKVKIKKQRLLKDMEIRFNNNQTVERTTSISETSHATFIIKDDVEGDITMSVKLMSDSTNSNSYTRYLVLDPHHSEVRIFNAKHELYVKTQEAILVGSYRHTHRIYFEFQLSPVTERTKRQMLFKFSLNHR